MLVNKIDGKKLVVIFCLLILISVLIISLLHLSIFKGKIDLETAVALSIISTIFSYLIILFNKNILNLGIFTVLFSYFTVSHFGASTLFILYPNAIFKIYEPHSYSWLYSEEVILAVLLCIVGQIFFIISGCFFGGKYSSNKPYNSKKNNISEKSVWLPRVGFICVVLVLGYFLFNIMAGNFSLTSNYDEFRSWRSETKFFSIAIFLLATGYVIVVATGSKNQLFKINILYIIVALILLITGNKGEILYAALAALGIYYTRTKKISFKIISLGIFVFFVLIPFITSSRSNSLIGSIGEIGVNVTAPFIEIGWQLRTVEAVVTWIESGETLGYGISYFAPFERIISKLSFGIIPEIPILGVPWSFGERLPGWGFSQVAESYFNFAVFGPIIFYLILGWFAIKAENKNLNIYMKSWYASIVVILMILTRNRFTFVPGQVLMALLLVALCYVLDGNLRNTSKKIFYKKKRM